MPCSSCATCSAGRRVEAAELLETSVAGANSALQRARATLEQEGVAAHSPAPHAPTQRELLRRYVDAWDRADVGALVALLREDAELRMPPQPSVVGGARSRASWATATGCAAQLVLRPAWANGRPAVVMYRQDAGGLVPHGVLLLQVDGERIAGDRHLFDQEVLAAFTARRLTPARAGDLQADPDQGGGRERAGAAHVVPADPAVEVVAPLGRRRPRPCGSTVARWSLSGTWCTDRQADREDQVDDAAAASDPARRRLRRGPVRPRRRARAQARP